MAAPSFFILPGKTKARCIPFNIPFISNAREKFLADGDTLSPRTAQPVCRTENVAQGGVPEIFGPFFGQKTAFGPRNVV